ncbi:hypothetical protein JCM19236_1564 [Vibrio sp. JCM 19236]|nr:hypothetical protein JCM19236_1564 [Vibrio sp. JCM 19236]
MQKWYTLICWVEIMAKQSKKLLMEDMGLQLRAIKKPHREYLWGFCSDY